MININEFMEMAKENILTMLPKDLTKDLTIEQNTVTKMNDQILYGLTMRREGEDAAPTIYMNDLFDRYMNGDPFKPMMAEVCQQYLDALVSRPEIATEELTFDRIKDNLTIRVMEAKRNSKFLEDVPYMNMGNGFVAICDIKVVEDNSGYWRTTINHGLEQENNYDRKEIFKAAIENSQIKEPVVMTTMMEQLFGDSDRNLLDFDGMIPETSKDHMYIISNKEGMLGASAFFYPGIREKIAEKLGEGFYAIPSSVHEVLVIPESCAPPIKDLADMVYEANHSVVNPNEVLSDNIFHYDKDFKRLETIQSEAVRDVRDDNLRS